MSYDKKDVCNNGIRILRGGNVNDLKITTFPEDVFLPEKYHDTDKQIRKNDIIVVASTGSKTVIGKAGYVDVDVFNTQIGAFLRIVRPLLGIIAPYLKLIFATEYYREHIRTQSQGTNINNVKAEYITEFRIPFPPLAEQERIVAEIEKFEPLIAEYDKLEQQATKLDGEIYDKLKKSILQHAIQGKLVPQNSNDEPASVLLERIRAEKKAQLGKKYVDSYIYKGDDNCYYEHINGKDVDITEELLIDIPDNWQWRRIENLFFVTKLAGFEYTNYFTKSAIAQTNEVPIVRAQNVKMNKFIENTQEFISLELSELLTRSSLTKDCLLMTFIGAGIGDTCLYSTPKRHHLAPNVAKLEPYSKEINLRYCLYWLMSPVGQQCVSNIKKMTAQPSLSMETIRSIFIAVPPLAEQKRIVEKIDQIFAKL